jgi:hypothetical protein
MDRPEEYHANKPDTEEKILYNTTYMMNEK